MNTKYYISIDVIGINRKTQKQYSSRSFLLLVLIEAFAAFDSEFALFDQFF